MLLGMLSSCLLFIRKMKPKLFLDSIDHQDMEANQLWMQSDCRADLVSSLPLSEQKRRRFI